MTHIYKIDYSTWTDSKLKSLAQDADKDGKEGLQSGEIIDFTRSAIENGFSNVDLFEKINSKTSKIGLKMAASATSSKTYNSTDPLFNNAKDYYNEKMTYFEKSDITSNTYTILQEKLYKMERAIDNAFQECDAYKDIVIVPRYHYRFYPNWDTRLMDFNLDELRSMTTRDMESLYKLKDNVEYIIEEANGETKHNEPEKTEYDVDDMAKKYLGMSYEEFVAKYKADFTYADMQSESAEIRAAYLKAKAYAKAMLQTTTNEAHTVNWDVGNRKTDETLKATGDMFTISEFEDEGITEGGLAELKSGIMFKSFEEALIDKYKELVPTAVEELNVSEKPKQPRKVLVNGAVLIFNPDGSVRDGSGRKIK